MKIGIITTDSDEVSGLDMDDCAGRLDMDYLEAIKKNLVKQGHKAKHVEINHLSINLLNKQNFDLIFNLCESGFENNSRFAAHVSAYLDMLKIPYSGGDYFNMEICTDKPLAKKMMLMHGIRTPRFQEFDCEKTKLSKKIGFPVIVKPIREDGSIGIRHNAIARTENQLQKRVADILKKYGQPALVEEYVEGREISVGIIGHDEELEVLPLSEVDFSQTPSGFDKILSYDAKWNEESEVYQKTPRVCPVKLEPDTYQEVVEMAINAFKIMRCRDYARLDFRIDSSSTPYLIEINPNPYLDEDSAMTIMAAEAGMSFGQLLDKIAKSAVKRHQKAETGLTEELEIERE